MPWGVYVACALVAAGFVGSSVSLALAPSLIWASRGAAWIVFAIGASAIAHYEYGLDFGVHEVLADAWDTEKVKAPGLMALSTAWQFVGLSLATQAATSHSRVAWNIGGALASCVAAWSSKVLLEEYVLEWHKLWIHGEPSLQALHTAVCFVVLGSALVCVFVARHDD